MPDPTPNPLAVSEPPGLDRYGRRTGTRIGDGEVHPDCLANAADRSPRRNVRCLWPTLRVRDVAGVPVFS